MQVNLGANLRCFLCLIRSLSALGGSRSLSRIAHHTDAGCRLEWRRLSKIQSGQTRDRRSAMVTATRTAIFSAALLAAVGTPASVAAQSEIRERIVDAVQG